MKINDFSHWQERYSRQMALPEIGKEGQEKLRQAHVAIVGVGALGTVTAEILVRSGVKLLTIIDRDVIELSNLQRQFLFSEKDIGKSKVVVAQEKLKAIDSEVVIHPYALHLNRENITILNGADLILDCTDNFRTRFLLNDFCRRENKPWIYAAAIRTKGMVMPILPAGPCLRCFLQETADESCDQEGVLNTAIVAAANIQATLALKLIVEITVESFLYTQDIWKQEFEKIKVRKKPSCPACRGQFDYLGQAVPEEKKYKWIKFCSRGKYQVSGDKIDVEQVRRKWERMGKVLDDGAALQFQEITLFRDGRILIKAETEHDAQELYSRYLE